MYVLAARKWLWSTWLATRVRPATSPPVTLQTFEPGDLAGHRLVYLCLHGVEGQHFLYGQAMGGRWVTALSTLQLARAPLAGAVVYLAGCWGVGAVADAVLEAGAAAVVGDRDSNWAGVFRPTGSNELGGAVVRRLAAGEGVGAAVAAASAAYLRKHSGVRERALVASLVVLGDREARVA